MNELIKLKLAEAKALVESHENESIIWHDKVMPTRVYGHVVKHNTIISSLGSSQSNGSVYSIYIYGDDKEIFECAVEWLYSSVGWGTHTVSDRLNEKETQDA